MIERKGSEESEGRKRRRVDERAQGLGIGGGEEGAANITWDQDGHGLEQATQEEQMEREERGL